MTEQKARLSYTLDSSFCKSEACHYLIRNPYSCRSSFFVFFTFSPFTVFYIFSFLNFMLFLNIFSNQRILALQWCVCFCYSSDVSCMYTFIASLSSSPDPAPSQPLGHRRARAEPWSARPLLVLSCFSRVKLFTATWAAACQAPLSMDFSRQEYCPPPGNLPDPGTEPPSLMSPALAGGFFTTRAPWEAPAAPTSCLLYAQYCEYVNAAPSVCPASLSPCCIHRAILYICPVGVLCELQSISVTAAC